MKKNKKNLFLKKIALILGISFITFVGCKTIPQTSLNPVKTVDVLDDEGAMYIRIPREQNSELLEVVVSRFLKGINESEAKTLVSKIDTVYGEFGSKSDKKRVQLAVDGNIPTITPSVLKKNGFEEKKYVASSLYKNLSDNFSTYSIFNGSELQLGLVSASQIIISKNIEKMIDLYNCERDSVNDINGMHLDLQEPYRADWKSTDLYNWISETVPSIRFYIVRPQAFLSSLIGSNMSSRVFNLFYAKGEFSKLPNSKYELTLDLEFTNARYVKPAVSLLILSMGLTDSDIKTLTPTHVQLTGVHLNSKQLVNMLGL